MPNPADVATPSMPRYRQRESRSVSWLSKGRGPASNQECRNPSDPRRYRDHSGLSIRSSSVAQDGPGSPVRREDAKDSEPYGPRSYEFCVDDLYNFARPHRALKFGDEMRIPAMQAGLTTRPMTLREIFPSALLWVSKKVRPGQSTVLVVDETLMPLAA